MQEQYESGKEAVDQIEEELFKEQFQKLRRFYQAPLRFSHNYGQFELRREREAQTIDLGKELFPHFTEDKILKIARMPHVNLENPDVPEVQRED